MGAHRYLSIWIAMAVATGLLYGCKPAATPSAHVASIDEIKLEIDASKAPLTLVHVWATWCDPCREEFPELLKACHEATEQGLALRLVSADDPQDLETVKQFLKDQASPVGTLVSEKLNQDFIELFSPNWEGALPATFFYDAAGKLLAEWQGKRSYDEYRSTIDRLLKK